MSLMMLSFAILFLLGRIVSLVVYRMCWSNGVAGVFSPPGALFTLLRRPLPWLMHLAAVWPVIGLSWRDWPLLHVFSSVGAGLLAIGAVGRFGCAGLGSFFWLDRLLVIALAIGVGFSPAFLYPCLIACCCLQYTVASWKLGPGYSNLLGWEFIRASLSVVTACLAVFGGLKIPGVVLNDFESLTLAVLLGYQASTYVNHALAKSALGPQWHSWIRVNRVQCLVTNAWLRGWTVGRNRDAVLKQARWIGNHRVGICAAVWILEFSWIFILADYRLALALLLATVLLHLILFALTGLAAFHYVANHLCLIWLIVAGDAAAVFRLEYLVAALVLVPCFAGWIGWLRRHMLAEYPPSGASGGYGKFADAADHLMAWWDTPLMRMYSYTVETRSGACFAVPVPRLSPHDTTLTDLHTHLMILGLHEDLDAMIERDRTIARTGVWGLVIHREDRDFLYRLMDARPCTCPPELLRDCPQAPWHLGSAGAGSEAALVLRGFFQGINRNLHQTWFRKILRWPHFPGEDLAPDICPLVKPALGIFRFDETIATVTIWRVRIFHHHREMMLIENEMVGRIEMDENKTFP
jgi:hypothetical protein